MAVHLHSKTTAAVRAVVPKDGPRDFFDMSFEVLARSIRAQRIGVLSPAFGLYHGASGETLDLEVGLVTDRAVRPETGGDAQLVPALPAPCPACHNGGTRWPA